MIFSYTKKTKRARVLYTYKYYVIIINVIVYCVTTLSFSNCAVVLVWKQNHILLDNTSKIFTVSNTLTKSVSTVSLATVRGTCCFYAQTSPRSQRHWPKGMETHFAHFNIIISRAFVSHQAYTTSTVFGMLLKHNCLNMKWILLHVYRSLFDQTTTTQFVDVCNWADKLELLRRWSHWRS